MKRKISIGIIPALLLACMVFTMTHAPDVYAADPQEPEVVATIGNTEYTTLKDAFNAANTNDTIVLQTDYEPAMVSGSNVSVPKGKRITFDLNGHVYRNTTESRAILIAVSNYKTELTITDSSKDQSGAIWSTGNENPTIYVGNEGKLTLARGKIIGRYYSGAICASGFNANVIINGGTVESDRGCAIYVASSAKATIERGYIKGGEKVGVYPTPAIGVDKSSVTINGGTIEGNIGVAWYYYEVPNPESNSTINITGGSISGTQYGISLTNGDKLTAGNTKKSCSIYGGTAAVYQTGGTADFGPGCQIASYTGTGVSVSGGTATIGNNAMIRGKVNAIDILKAGSVTLNSKLLIEGDSVGIHMNSTKADTTPTLTVNGNADPVSSADDVTIVGHDKVFDLEGSYNVTLNHGRYVGDSTVFSTAGTGTMNIPTALVNRDVTSEIQGNTHITDSDNMEMLLLDDDSYGAAKDWYLIGQKNVTHHPETPATCQEEGRLEHYYCETCKRYFSADGHLDENIISEDSLIIQKVPHNIVKVPVKESTCTEAGIAEHYECSFCHACFRDEAGKQPVAAQELSLPLADHQLTETPAAASTCIKPGNSAYWTCSVCKNYFDENGQQILENSWILPLAPHQLQHHPRVEPTTETTGTGEYWECTVCGKLFSDAYGNNWIPAPVMIPKLKPADPEQPSDPGQPADSGQSSQPNPPAPGSDPGQNGADGTPVGPGASAAAAERAITGMVSDDDPQGTVFGKVALKSPKQTKTSIDLKWNAVPNAASYVIYGNKCGKGIKPVKLGVVNGTRQTVSTVVNQKVAKGTYYKFLVVALDRNNTVVSTSKVIHVATKGGKVGNHKKVTVKKSVIKKAKKLKVGKSLKLKAKAVPQAKKLKVRKHRPVLYESTDNNVATVSKKGVVKAKNKGTCYIYAYAQNGVFKAVKVVVK